MAEVGLEEAKIMSQMLSLEHWQKTTCFNSKNVWLLRFMGGCHPPTATTGPCRVLGVGRGSRGISERQRLRLQPDWKGCIGCQAQRRKGYGAESHSTSQV